MVQNRVKVRCLIVKRKKFEGRMKKLHSSVGIPLQEHFRCQAVNQALTPFRWGGKSIMEGVKQKKEIKNKELIIMCEN